MTTNDDIRLLLAYFNLRSPRQYCPLEIAYRRHLRIRFLKVARTILGDVLAKEIILRLLSLERCK